MSIKFTLYNVYIFDIKNSYARIYLSSKIKRSPVELRLKILKSSLQLKDSIFSVFEKVTINYNYMNHYYVHTLVDDNNDHEVHEGICHKMPNMENRIYLGIFSSCKDAVEKAKKIYPRSNGCYWCSRECHTQ